MANLPPLSQHLATAVAIFVLTRIALTFRRYRLPWRAIFWPWNRFVQELQQRKAYLREQMAAQQQPPITTEVQHETAPL